MEVRDLDGEKVGKVEGVYEDALPPVAYGRQGYEDVIATKPGILGLGQRLYLPASAFEDVSNGAMLLGTRRKEFPAPWRSCKPPASSGSSLKLRPLRSSAPPASPAASEMHSPPWLVARAPLSAKPSISSPSGSAKPAASAAKPAAAIKIRVGIIMAQILVAATGIGYMLQYYGEGLRLHNYFAPLIVTAVLAVLLNQLTAGSERRLIRWKVNAF